jgi:hypothetical protein
MLGTLFFFLSWWTYRQATARAAAAATGSDSALESQRLLHPDSDGLQLQGLQPPAAPRAVVVPEADAEGKAEAGGGGAGWGGAVDPSHVSVT